MARKILTDAEVEQEIERLKDSPEVKLAQKEQRIRYRRRQYLWTLRTMAKRGAELLEAGITMEMLNSEEASILGVEL